MEVDRAAIYGNAMNAFHYSKTFKKEKRSTKGDRSLVVWIGLNIKLYGKFAAICIVRPIFAHSQYIDSLLNA
jgi:hypothetical protein